MFLLEIENNDFKGITSFNNTSYAKKKYYQNEYKLLNINNDYNKKNNNYNLLLLNDVNSKLNDDYYNLLVFDNINYNNKYENFLSTKRNCKNGFLINNSYENFTFLNLNNNKCNPNFCFLNDLENNFHSCKEGINVIIYEKFFSIFIFIYY